MALLGKYRDKIDAVLNDSVWKDPFSTLTGRWQSAMNTVDAITEDGTDPPDPNDWTTFTDLRTELNSYLTGTSNDGDDNGKGETSLKTSVVKAGLYFGKTTQDRMRVANALSEMNKQVAILDSDPAPGKDGDGCQLHMANLMGAISQVRLDALDTETTLWELYVENLLPEMSSDNASWMLTIMTGFRDGVITEKTNNNTKIQDADDEYMSIIAKVKATSFIMSFEDMWDDPCMQMVLNGVVDTSGWGLP